MQEFRVLENGFRGIQKRLIIMMSVMMGGIFLIVGIVPELMSVEPRWGRHYFYS